MEVSSFCAYHLLVRRLRAHFEEKLTLNLPSVVVVFIKAFLDEEWIFRNYLLKCNPLNFFVLQFFGIFLIVSLFLKAFLTFKKKLIVKVETKQQKNVKEYFRTIKFQKRYKNYFLLVKKPNKKYPQQFTLILLINIKNIKFNWNFKQKIQF